MINQNGGIVMNFEEFRKILIEETNSLKEGQKLRLIDTGYSQQFLQKLIFNHKITYFIHNGDIFH